MRVLIHDSQIKRTRIDENTVGLRIPGRHKNSNTKMFVKTHYYFFCINTFWGLIFRKSGQSFFGMVYDSQIKLRTDYARGIIFLIFLCVAEE